MDIVEQLRKSANIVYNQDGYTFRIGLQNEAADEIEKLQEEVEHYKKDNIRLKTEKMVLFRALRRVRAIGDDGLGIIKQIHQTADVAIKEMG